MVLPTFVVAGAMKSGTTSLCQYLGQHPDVFIPQPKEPHFFSHNYYRGLDWYESLFAGTESFIARGDGSTSYTKMPQMAGAAARLADTVPDIRIIYIMRNPVDRTFSHYCHQVRHGRESRPFTSALAAEPEYLNLSRYAMQLAELDRYFNPDQIALFASSKLESTKTRQATVTAALQFLGISNNSQIDTSQNWHVTARKLAEKGIYLPPDPGVRMLPPRLHRRLAARLRNRGKPPRTPVAVAYKMTPATRRIIASQLADDVAALRLRWPATPAWKDFV